MGWLDRFLGRKDSAVGGMLSVRNVGQPVWSGRNYRAFAKEGYGQNPVAYRCIRMIAENVAAIPFLAYEGNKEMANHPLLTVLNRANPWQSGAELIDAFISYLKLHGDAFFEAVILDGQLRELYALRPDRMKAIPGRRGYPQAWRYSVESSSSYDFQMDLRPSEQTPIMHLREFNPLNDWYGMSPMEAASFAIDVHNSAGGYNKALLDNSASPSGALVYKAEGDGDGKLSDDQFIRLKRELEEKHSGAANAGRPLLLEGGLEWQPMGMSPREMEFVVGKREAAREIALAFGVPPMLLGIPGDNTYSNFAEANRAFHRQTVLPLMDRLCDALSNWIQPTYPGLRLTYDVDQVEALSVEREAVWSRVEKASFLTTDEKREAVGYEPYSPTTQPGGSILVGGAMMPLDEVGFQPGGAAPSGNPDAAGD